MILENLVKTELSWQQLLFVSLAYLFGIISIILFLRKKISVSILFLFSAALILRFLLASFDPFLNLWDEQFHALVAKNLMKDPLTPLLYEHPMISYDPGQWINNHVWLHKQPWFLWQISIFLKVFGTSEFIVRIPTVIMCSLLVPVIYRIGTLTTNRLTGWLAAFFYTFSFFWVNFCAGSTFSDHNDAAFIFYVTLSIWSWLEYRYSKKPGWIVLIGIFSGIAVLNKWLPGLLVYSGWFISLLMTKKPESRIIELRRFLLSLVITILVALPWQIYIHYRFPVESIHELRLNALHFVHPIEGHGGNALYYIEMLVQQYGGPMIFLFLLAGLFLFFRNIPEKGVRYGLLAMFLTVYLFYTVAATKMPLFTSMIFPVIFLSLAALGEKLISIAGNILKARWLNLMLFIILCYIGVNGLNFKQICEWHSDRSSGWAQWHKAAIVDCYFGEKYPVKNAAVFNCGGFNSIQFMFYNGNTAYGSYPSKEDYKKIKDQKIRIFVFADQNIPPFLNADPDVTKIYLSGFQY